jgi:hypothetical protein
MAQLAHFTPAELPGTFAVLLCGIVIGAAAALRRRDTLMLAVICFFALAATGSVLDRFEGVSGAVKTGADVAFLLAAVVLAAQLSAADRDRSDAGTAHSPARR